MRIDLNTAGSHGDVYPFIAVGRALAARGHDVTVFCHDHFASDLAEAGLAHVPTCSEIDHLGVLRDPRMAHPRKSGRVVLGMIRESAPGALRVVRETIEARRPDAMVSHHICIGTRSLCEAAGIPVALVTLTPLFWLSMHDPVPAPQQRPGRMRAAGARVAQRAMRRLVPPLANRLVNGIRRDAGIPAERDAFLHDLLGGDALLGMWSPRLRPGMPDDPPHGQICGYPWYDGDVTAPLDPEIESFLAAGTAPIVFALGTTAVHHPRGFYEIAAEACARLGRRGVLLTGTLDAAPPSLPEGVRAFAYAPFSRLLPRGCATVHHGGAGSTGQALRAGRPMVIVPHAFDQFNHGVRVTELGLGVQVHRRRLTVKRLVAALRAVLEDPAMEAACRETGRSIREENGAVTAAEAIEAMVDTRRATVDRV